MLEIKDSVIFIKLNNKYNLAKMLHHRFIEEDVDVSQLSHTDARILFSDIHTVNIKEYADEYYLDEDFTDGEDDDDRYTIEGFDLIADFFELNEALEKAIEFKFSVYIS